MCQKTYDAINNLIEVTMTTYIDENQAMAEAKV
jgi:hypothetical protein